MEDGGGGQGGEDPDERFAGCGADGEAFDDVALEREGGPEGESEDDRDHDRRGSDEARGGLASEVDGVHDERAADAQLEQQEQERVGQGS